MSERNRWSPYASIYDPMRVSNIDGSAEHAHDRAIIRACKATNKPNPKLKNRPKCTLFVGRLDLEVNNEDLNKVFSKHGKLRSVTVVRDLATGFSKRYGFVEFKHSRDAERAQRAEHRKVLKGREILVDFQHQGTLPGWIPRRLGGGFGGRKESGQLRFGCLDRPWKRSSQIGLGAAKKRGHSDNAHDERRRDREDRSHHSIKRQKI